MSEQIDLGELRHIAQEASIDQRDFDFLCDSVLVLIEAVEAAKSLTSDRGEPPVALAVGIKDRWRAQQQSLARFTGWKDPA